MKKRYSSPKLTVHGDVEKLTQAFGNSAVNDTIIYGSLAFPGNGGSRDGIVVPKP